MRTELEVTALPVHSDFHLYNISFPSFQGAETITDLVYSLYTERKLLKILIYYHLSKILHLP